MVESNHVEKNAVLDYVHPKRRRRFTLQRTIHHSVRFAKHLYQHARFSTNNAHIVLFVVGCQRSGTDMVIAILDRDLKARTFPEMSKLTSQDQPAQLRLNPLAEVKRELNKVPAPLIALKPLVESQNVLKLIDYFRPAKAIWLYRNYQAVSASHIKRWGGHNSVHDLKYIVDRTPDNWRTENISDELHEIVARNFSLAMDVYDAAALVWYVRNSHYFTLNLAANPDVTICRYEDLVQQPADVMRSVYDFIGLKYPGDHIVSIVHSNVVNRGHNLTLSPEIKSLCEGLQAQLDQAWNAQLQRFTLPT